MKTTKRYIVLALCLSAAGFPAVAEEPELQKSIVVEKDFVPVETKAEKLSVLPEELPLTAETSELDFSDWAIPAKVSPVAVTQQPLCYANTFSPSANRGYAYFGMGNYLNTVGGAGYSIVRTEQTALDLWLRHCGIKGHINGLLPNLPDGEIYSSRFVTDDKLGLRFAHEFSAGTLSADASYRYSAFNYYGTVSEIPGGKRQRVNDFKIGMLWKNHARSSNLLNYHVGAGYGFFGNRMPYWDFSTLAGGGLYFADAGKTSGLKENDLNLTGGVELAMEETSFFGADAEFRFLGYSGSAGQLSAAVIEDERGSETNALKFLLDDPESFGMLTLSPYYRLQNDRLSLKLGVRMDFSFNNGKGFRIAPDVKFDWAISNKVSLAVSAVGGNRINTLSEVSARNRYLHPGMLLPTTYTMMDATGELNIGLFRGFSIAPMVGFAFVKKALIPELPLLPNGGTGILGGMLMYEKESSVIYRGKNMNGFKAGIKASYRYDELAEVKLSYLFTPQGKESGYVYSDDRAEHNLSAQLKVTPIPKLDLFLNYDLRTRRHLFANQYMLDSQPDGMVEMQSVPGSLRLEDVHNLGFGAAYRISSLFRVFGQIDNMLNRRYQDYYGLYAQRANFVLGLGLDF